MAAATRAEAQWQSFRMCVVRGVRSLLFMIKNQNVQCGGLQWQFYRRLEKGYSILGGTQTMELPKKIPRLHPQCRMKTEEPSFCRLHIENGEERKTRLERWLTRKLSQPLLRPPPLPNNLHDLYFIGALATSELAQTYSTYTSGDFPRPSIS